MDGTQITAAIIGGGALLGSTSLPAVLAFVSSRRTHAIVQGNGHGDVAQMAEQALIQIGELSARLDAHAAQDLDVTERLQEGQELIREGQVVMLMTLRDGGFLNPPQGPRRGKGRGGTT